MTAQPRSATSVRFRKSSTHQPSALASVRLFDDRLAVDELDPVDVPGAAGRAAAQRFDGQAQFIPGLERLAAPTVAGKCARAAAFEIPCLDVSVLVLDVENDEGVRTGV